MRKRDGKRLFVKIKHVLPALFPNEPELNYHNLPLVHNGGVAKKELIVKKSKRK